MTIPATPSAPNAVPRATETLLIDAAIAPTLLPLLRTPRLPLLRTLLLLLRTLPRRCNLRRTAQELGRGRETFRALFFCLPPAEPSSHLGIVTGPSTVPATPTLSSWRLLSDLGLPKRFRRAHDFDSVCLIWQGWVADGRADALIVAFEEVFCR